MQPSDSAIVLNGMVKDAYTQKPLANVNVYVDGKDMGVMTNVDGVPGATNPGYIRENIAAAQGEVGGKPFALTEREMKQMRELNKEQRFFNVTYEQVKGFGNTPHYGCTVACSGRTCRPAWTFTMKS